MGPRLSLAKPPSSLIVMHKGHPNPDSIRDTPGSRPFLNRRGYLKNRGPDVFTCWMQIGSTKTTEPRSFGLDASKIKAEPRLPKSLREESAGCEPRALGGFGAGGWRLYTYIYIYIYIYIHIHREREIDREIDMYVYIYIYIDVCTCVVCYG